MSQPIVSEVYKPTTTISSPSSPSSAPTSELSTSPRSPTQRPRLYGPINASSSLISPKLVPFDKNSASTSFKAPARLTQPSSSSLSAPTLAKKHVKAHSTDAVESKAKTSQYAKVSAPTSAETTNSPTKSSLFSGKIVDPSPTSTQPALPASEIAVTTQPPPVDAIKTENSSSSEGREEQQNSATTSTPAPGPSNQIPTIAQRDALASRVYSVCRSAGHINWLHLLDLSPLASQHHLSGYNCMKFGNQGSPYAYFPLSLQQPLQADALIEKQRVSETEAMKWLSQKHKAKKKEQSKDRGSKRGGGVLEEDGSRGKDMLKDGRGGIEYVVVENEDSAMRDASPPQDNAQSVDELKVDGPIDDNLAIDDEYEAPLAAEEKKNQPIEDRVAEVKAVENDAASPSQQSIQTIKTSDSHPISISAMIPPELLIDFTHYVNKGIPDGVRFEVEKKAIDDEIVAPEHCSKQLEAKRLIRCHTTHVDLCNVAQKAEKEMIEASQNRRRPRALAFKDDSNSVDCLEIICTNGEESDNDAIPVAFGGSYRGFTIGNLLLSSCPGKKVRLTGPVRGRGAICRNLGLDLKRIRQLGVGALICCLDDEELNFLGAPWTLYEKEADQLGIEVIRLPMAEGFSPTDVTLTDNVITSVVEQYTLRGINVLVHCRGGVGRAGLIACTWMVKLGLVQSPEEDQQHQQQQQQQKQESSIKRDDLEASEKGTEQQDMMKLCQRLIETIRKRRSPKAIETAEQVAFLVKYLDFIKKQEISAKMAESSIE